MPVSPRVIALLLAAVASFAGLGLAPVAASADSVSIDFESGPAVGTPVNDEYYASKFVRFVAADPGYRPYRRTVGNRARSGSTVADVGIDVCSPENGGGNICEFVQSTMTARLKRTATTVTLYAGLFPGTDGKLFPGVAARLIALNSQGQPVATGPTVPLPTSTSIVNNPGGGAVSGAARATGRLALPGGIPGFTTPITVTSAASDIASFRLEAVDAVANSGASQNAQLGFDDLTLDYPANSLPDFSVTADPLVAVLDGLSKDVPVTVSRLNLSDGPIALSASGLPSGVTADFTPNPLPAGQESAVMRLTASPTAPRLDDPADVTITADPQNDANVGPGLRTAHTLVRVAAPFELRSPLAPTVSVGSCTDTDVPLVIARDNAFVGTVQLSLSALPVGVTAQILPDTTVVPGGGFNADRTLRFHVEQGAALPTFLTVTATSPGAPTRTLQLAVRRSGGTAELASAFETAKTPQHLVAGTTVTVTGSGFCPGTAVQVGSPQGTADATVAPDGRSLTFVTPRTASTGPVTIVPPGSERMNPFATSHALIIDNFRNTVGFAFHNPSFSALSYDELTDAFGNDDMWVTFNPCWPWGTCRVNTGIPDPLSYAEWGVLNLALRASGGHCFGISRGAEQLRLGRVAYSRFQTSVYHGFDLPSAGGPSSNLGSWLDGQHALQGSAEFLGAYAHRDRTVGGQLATLESELRANRDPIITMHHDDGSVFGVGHAVLAYDQEFVPGGIDIYVYDSNRESTAPGDPGGTTGSVIHITQSNQRWSMTQANGDVWTGGGDGTLFIASQSTIPANPSLPSLSSLLDLPALILGSDGGAAHASAVTPGATAVPVTDGAGGPSTAGWVLGTTPGQEVSATMVGDKPGTYSTAVNGPGFAGAVTDVPTKPGVTDTTGGTPSQHEITFTSGQDRALHLTVATTTPTGGAARDGEAAGGPTSSTAATISTHASKGGKEAAALTSRGQLSYEHGGSPTSFSFTLTKTSDNGGPQQFQSPGINVAGGDKVTVSPLGATASSVTLTIKSKSGRTRKQVVRNGAKAPARLSLTPIKVAQAGGKRSVKLTANVSRLKAGATGAVGIAVRVMRGSKVVAQHTESNGAAGVGSTPVSWTLPALAKGRYRVVVDARLAVGGATPGSVTAHRTAALKLP